MRSKDEVVFKKRFRVSNSLAEHLDKIKAAKDAGGYTNSMEREVRNFRQLIEAARQVLRK